MNVAFKTVGCRLNQAETAAIRARFEAAGYCTVATENDADVVVIHTCTITGKAERNCIRIARSCRRRTPPPLIVLAGCAVEVSADRLRREGVADILAGQGDKLQLPQQVAQHLQSPPLPVAESSPAAVPLPVFSTIRALVKAQDGCDFRCTYCIVPSARGIPVSRPAGEIEEEVRRLVELGYREIVLTGANLACYRDGPNTLVMLIARLESIEGLARIRLSSVEPSATQQQVLDYLPDSGKLCRHLHIPLQSGDDRILRAMGRRYTAGQFRAAIESAVSRMPLLGLGTDIIVGFPGEDPAAFANTFALVRELPFSNLHVFPYSVRPGTPAAAMKPAVPAGERKARSDALIQLGREKRAAFAAAFVGRPVSVLVESLSPSMTGHGWTGEYLEADVTGRDVTANRIFTFAPRSVREATLVGEVQAYPAVTQLRMASVSPEMDTIRHF